MAWPIIFKIYLININISQNPEDCKIILNTSGYGSGNFNRWFDLPLSVTGAIKLKYDELIPIDTGPIAAIPSIDPTIIKGDMSNIIRPIFGLPKSTNLLQYLAKKIGISISDIKYHELCLADAYPPKYLAKNKETKLIINYFIT